MLIYKKKIIKNKKSQVWIETVIYTLIGLAIIGILLGIIKPVIEERQDKAIIEQSIEMLNTLSNEIDELRYYGVGNSRIIELKIKNGIFTINKNDSLEFFLDSKHGYSQNDEEVEIGKIKAKTTKKTKGYNVALKLDYKDSLNLTWNHEDEERVLQKAPVPYRIIMLNNGTLDKLVNIDFSSG